MSSTTALAHGLIELTTALPPNAASRPSAQRAGERPGPRLPSRAQRSPVELLGCDQWSVGRTARPGIVDGGGEDGRHGPGRDREAPCRLAEQVEIELLPSQRERGTPRPRLANGPRAAGSAKPRICVPPGSRTIRITTWARAGESSPGQDGQGGNQVDDHVDQALLKRHGEHFLRSSASTSRRAVPQPLHGSGR